MCTAVDIIDLAPGNWSSDEVPITNHLELTSEWTNQWAQANLRRPYLTMRSLFPMPPPYDVTQQTKISTASWVWC